MKGYVLFCILLFIFQTTQAQQSRWVEVTGEANMANITPEEARTKALNDARAEAVRIVAGVRVSSEIFDIYSEVSSSTRLAKTHSLFSTFNRSVSYGRVVDEQILNEGIVPGTLIYQVRLKAKVALEKGKVDPSFQLYVDLNKRYFTEGEDMQITLRSSKECYVTIFNVLPNDSLWVLLPNARITDNHLLADSTFVFPPPGYRLRTGLLPGTKRSVEMIFVIATRKKIDFMPGEESTGSFPPIVRR